MAKREHFLDTFGQEVNLPVLLVNLGKITFYLQVFLQ